MKSQRMFYLDWPLEVSVETLALCNARCTFCPYPTLDRKGVRMTDAMIDRIITELKDHPWPFIFSPFKVNEPFLDKRLLPICRKVEAQLPNATIRLFSNGSALTDTNIEGVAGLTRVAHLWVSLNDHRADQYEKTMGLPFDRTAKNLDYLHEEVEAGRFPHDVVVSRVRDCNAELSEADSGFDAYVKARWPRFTPFLIKRDGWLGFTDPVSKEVPDAGCSRWYELSITATGKVALCCMDGAGEHAIGDINESSLFEIYNGRDYRNRRVFELSRKSVNPCNRCTY